MKRFGILALLVVVLAFTTTALADAGGIPAVPDMPGAHRPWFPPGKTTGEQVFIHWAPTETFPANEPFFIAHGWAFIMHHEDLNVVNGKKDATYALELDGELLKEDYINKRVTPAVQDEWGDHWRQTMWIYNFPDGLEGTHTFVAKYWVECQILVDFGIISGPCADPEELTLYGMYEVIIDFE